MWEFQNHRQVNVTKSEYRIGCVYYSQSFGPRIWKLELYADGPQRFQTVAKDIFIWSLGPKRSANRHLTALTKSSYLLTILYGRRSDCTCTNSTPDRPNVDIKTLCRPKQRNSCSNDLRAQPMPTKMTIRQTARPTKEIETISRTATAMSPQSLQHE